MSDAKILETAICRWVNQHAAKLHGDVDGKVPDNAQGYLAEIEPEQVLVSRSEGDVLVVLVNRGPLGTAKYRVPFADLELPKAETVPDVREPQSNDEPAPRRSTKGKKGN